MFTVKILNYTHSESQQGEVKLSDNSPELMSVYLREWGPVEVWLPASQNFKDKVEELKQSTYDDYHNDLSSEEITVDELNVLIEMQGEYKAFITYEDRNGDDAFYCIAENEEVYITDRHGNTVHSIK